MMGGEIIGPDYGEVSNVTHIQVMPCGGRSTGDSQGIVYYINTLVQLQEREKERLIHECP